MKIPLSWLKEFIHLQDTPENIAQKLTDLGLEVEKIEKEALSFDSVVVARVIDAKRHPNAEKLQIATVFDGKEYFQVVCGATNCRAGLKTALAKIGATLTDHEGKKFKIKKSKLRGEESCGMLCAAQELGLEEGQEHGILELPDDLPEGKPLEEIYGDAIFEISLTPNLGHCLSVMGIARELSAVLHQPLRWPQAQVTTSASSSPIDIVNQAPEKCLRYGSQVISGVKVAPSPAWLVSRLKSCGLRSINNIVDVTNYVMLCFGLPLHAFDLNKIEGSHIVIREAKDGERLQTIDKQTQELKAFHLLIADEKKPLALAGIMGGLASEVTDQTETILLEAAYFHPQTIRNGSKKLMLSTEASRRFERGVDPALIEYSLQYTTSLILQIAGGTPSAPCIEPKNNPIAPRQLKFLPSYINKILGTQLAISEIETILQRLSFQVSLLQEEMEVQVPSWRHDIQAPIDLTEEVARLIGYRHIPRPVVHFRPSQINDSPLYHYEQKIRERLLTEGLQELVSSNLIGGTQVNALSPTTIATDQIIHVQNPSSQDQSVLRPSFLPGFLKIIKDNLDQKTLSFAGFEIGNVYFQSNGQLKEYSSCGLILTGDGYPVHWQQKPRPWDFFDLKGMIENLLEGLQITKFSFSCKTPKEEFHPGRQALIYCDEILCGHIGEIHPHVLQMFDIKQRVYFAEINVQDLMQARKKDSFMQPLPIYPSSSRDWTLTLEAHTKIEDVLNTIQTVRSGLLSRVSLINLYFGAPLKEGLKNATFQLIYRDMNKTLSVEEIEAEHRRITQGVLEKLIYDGKVVIST